MIDKKTHLDRNTSRWHTAILAAFTFVAFSAAASIPFIYESTTLWYKFGIDRSVLLLGQIIGLVTVVLLACQLLVAARFDILARIISHAGVYRLHQRIGLLIMLLALTHALLILIPEGMNNLPIGWKFWPEMIGVLALSLLILQVAAAFYRSNLRLHIQLWRRFHWLMGYAIFLVLNIHVLFVSTSFAQGLPRYALLLFSGSVLVAGLLHKTPFLRRRSS